MVKIYFKGQNLHYLIPRYILESKSLLIRPFFNVRRLDAVEAGKDITIQLPGGDGKAARFEHYVSWLVNRAIKTVHDGKETNADDQSYLTLARLYLLGQLLEDIEFQDEVLGIFIIKITAEMPGHFFANRDVAQVVRTIYDNTTDSNDRYRRLLVTVFACFAAKEDVVRLRGALRRSLWRISRFRQLACCLYVD